MYHTPKIVLETTLKDGSDINYNYRYYYPPLERYFQPISISNDLGKGRVKIKMREV